uniref:Uracil-DNA glycosylase n=1 Tax=Mesocestoides corti TaxID=53468 RepID=A0A5K3EHU6_MESCO
MGNLTATDHATRRSSDHQDFGSHAQRFKLSTCCICCFFFVNWHVWVELGIAGCVLHLSMLRCFVFLVFAITSSLCILLQVLASEAPTNMTNLLCKCR